MYVIAEKFDKIVVDVVGKLSKSEKMDISSLLDKKELEDLLELIDNRLSSIIKTSYYHPEYSNHEFLGLEKMKKDIQEMLSWF